MIRDESKSSLNELLKGRDNNFNLIRLIAAILVIFSHSYPLAGSDQQDFLYNISNRQMTLGNLAVYIFFMISGVLITQSYMYSNNLVVFIKARLLRIFPALFGVILFSVFIIGPLFTTLSLKEYFTNNQTYEYLKSVFLFPLYWNLPGVFNSNPYGNPVNGSIWTIPFEFLCYLLVGLLGIVGLLKRRYFVFLITIGIFYCNIFWSAILPDGGGHIFGLEVSTFLELALFFLVGSIICLFKEKIYINKQLVMIGIVILFISLFYGGFKTLFAIFGPILILYFAFIPIPKVFDVLKKEDFSYGVYLYAFPVQQVVSNIFGTKLSPFINFLIALPVVLLLSIISWFLIEKKMLQLKKKQVFKLDKSNITKLYTNRIRAVVNGALDFLFYPNWVRFFIFFVFFSVLLINYNAKPTVITFPYINSQNIFNGGWLPQSNNENYRWVSKRASVDISFPSKEAVLKIEGFVPENFKEVTGLKVFLNDNQISDVNLRAGEGIDLKIPCTSLMTRNTIILEFNSVHAPDHRDLDQRIMSAMISRIMVE